MSWVPGEDLIKKMWDSLIDRGIGTLLRPWADRRAGRAAIDVKREEMLAIAQAQRDAEAIRRGDASYNSATRQIEYRSTAQQVPTVVGENKDSPLMLEGSVSEFGADAIDRQVQVAKAIVYAQDELMQGAAEPPKGAPSATWLARWKELAGSAHDDDLHRLWGAILAGEIKQPGKHSLRTLQFLHTLSKDEAALIERVLQFTFQDYGFFEDEGQTLLAENGLTMNELMQLEQMGIISDTSGTRVKKLVFKEFPNVQLDAERPASLGMVIDRKPGSDALAATLTFRAFVLTMIGREIKSISAVQTNTEHLRCVCRKIASQGWSTALCTWQRIGPGQVACNIVESFS